MPIPALISTTARALKLARNPVIVNIPAYQLGTVADRTRLKYELLVYVSNGVAFTLATTLAAREEPASSVAGIETYGGAYFDIAKILQAELENTIAAKADKYDPSRIIQAANMVLPYYVVQKIYLDDALEETITQPVAYAYNGSIAEEDFAAYADTFFTNYIGSTGKFITYKPDGTRVLPAAPEYLLWLHNYAASITSLKLCVRGFYTDAPTTEVGIVQPLATLSSVSAMEAYAIPVGPDVVVGPADNQLEADNLIYYEVWLQNQADARVSEVRRYYYDATYHRQAKHLIYINSLGAATVVTATGQSATDIKTSRTEAQQFRGYSYAADIAATVVNEISGEQTYTLRLQRDRLTNLAYLADVQFTRQAYIIYEGKTIPVLPITDSFRLQDDSTVWQGIELSFKQAYAKTAFSLLPAAEAVSEQQTAWRPLATACDLDSRSRYNGLLKVVTLERYYTATGESVQPAQVRPNTPGSDVYIPPIASSSCALANTPYLSAEYTKTGTYRNQTCAVGLVGDYPTITIAEDSWGSTENQPDADAKAEAEANQLDTQAYANANGACNTVGVYTPPGGVPSGQWWLRVVSFDVSKTDGSGISADGNPTDYRPGNMWFNANSGPSPQANQSGVNLGADKLDSPYPALAGPRYYTFYLYLQNNGGTTRTLRFFRNGLQVGGSTTSSAYLTQIVFPANPVNGDTWYIDIN